MGARWVILGSRIWYMVGVFFSENVPSSPDHCNTLLHLLPCSSASLHLQPCSNALLLPCCAAATHCCTFCPAATHRCSCSPAAMHHCICGSASLHLCISASLHICSPAAVQHFCVIDSFSSQNDVLVLLSLPTTTPDDMTLLWRGSPSMRSTFCIK